MAAFTQQEKEIGFALHLVVGCVFFPLHFIQAFCFCFVVLQIGRTTTIALPHGLNKAGNRWVLLLILSRV